MVVSTHYRDVSSVLRRSGTVSGGNEVTEVPSHTWDDGSTPGGLTGSVSRHVFPSSHGSILRRPQWTPGYLRWT